MQKFSVAIADSQYLIKVGLRHILAKLPVYQVVGEATEENSLLQLLRDTQPDILILDYDQPGYFSTDTIFRIKKIAPGTHLIIISADENKKSIYGVLESGVESYLSKICDEEEIINALAAAAKGEKFYCTRVLNHLLEKSFPKDADCLPTPLSPREIEIVRLVASGLIAKEIADRLNLSTHTVYTHRKNIMKKLQLSTTSELVLYAVNMGII